MWSSLNCFSALKVYTRRLRVWRSAPPEKKCGTLDTPKQQNNFAVNKPPGRSIVDAKGGETLRASAHGFQVCPSPCFWSVGTKSAMDWGIFVILIGPCLAVMNATFVVAANIFHVGVMGWWRISGHVATAR